MRSAPGRTDGAWGAAEKIGAFKDMLIGTIRKEIQEDGRWKNNAQSICELWTLEK